MAFPNVRYSKQPRKCYDDSELFLSTHCKHAAVMKVKKIQLARCSSSPDASNKKPADFKPVAREVSMTTPILKQPNILSNVAHNRVEVARLEAQLHGANNMEISRQRDRLLSSFSEKSSVGAVLCCDDCMYRTNKCVTCCTCLCCVQALFYHCASDNDGERGLGADNHCSCNGPLKECLCRWSVLGILSVFMPCFLCYPFIRVFQRCFNDRFSPGAHNVQS